MIYRFCTDVRGNFITIAAFAMVPILGVLALAVDYSQVSRQRQATLSALDAAGIATARRIAEGATDDQAKAYAKEFFEANLGSVNPANTTLTVLLPNNNTGGGTLKLTVALKYKPVFLPTAAMLIGRTSGDVDFSAQSEIRLKNTLEVALVLDNSGSMLELGHGSSQVRFDLLKAAAKQLVDTIAAQSAQMKQVVKPVQFGVVPFAASVNIGSDKASATWMDKDGISPIHHDQIAWTTMSSGSFPTKYAQKTGAIWYARGTGWGTQKDKPLTRFSLYNLMKRSSGGSVASWAGCVESRPSPYNNNDVPASSATPATLFVLMFSTDETDLKDGSNRAAASNWWPDVSTSSNNYTRQTYAPKYFAAASSGPYGLGAGPNASCTTKPITALADISTTAGKTTVKAAIDAMAASGGTNVPEGMAWGWRVVSSGAPFTEGRPETEKGNDKVVIVLTDGANTYYTPNYLGNNDLGANKSTYSSYGYAGRTTVGYSFPRIFLDTPSTVSKTTYSEANYTKALNAQFGTLCANAKAANVLVMTVSLDLDAGDATEKAQMDALKACSSDSRFRKDPVDPSKAGKMYWNATGSTLSEKFKEIADELSNLRIVG